MIDIVEPKEQLSKDNIIDEAEKYNNKNGAISFARGVRWAIKKLLPVINDYNRQKIKKLIE